MRVVPKTVFSELTALELATLDETLEIQSHGETVGYFLSPTSWHILYLVITGIEWDDKDELGYDALDIVIGPQTQGDEGEG